MDKLQALACEGCPVFATGCDTIYRGSTCNARRWRRGIKTDPVFDSLSISDRAAADILAQRIDRVQTAYEGLAAYKATGLTPEEVVELKSQMEAVHRALDFAEQCRHKCKSQGELGVSNGLALGKIAVWNGHEFMEGERDEQDKN